MPQRLSARADRALTDHAVTELLADALRRDVVPDRATRGSERAEAPKRQLQDGGALFSAQAPALPRSAEPGAATDLSAFREVAAMQALAPDHAPVEERHEVSIPAAWLPALKTVLVERDEVFLVQRVSPGDAERHLLWWVDPGGGHAVQSDDLVVRGKPKLKTWRPKADGEEGCQVPLNVNGSEART